MEDSLESVRSRLCSAHGNVLAMIEASADATVDTWPADAVAERHRVVDPFRTALAERDVIEELPAILEDLVATAGGDLSVPPVAAPPYVVVTSMGVLLRATLPRGRLVVAIHPFVVDRKPSPTYHRRDELAIEVSWAE
ncbi:hypothetical protein Halru_1514 [Halovivax ruber XH-70]|uniref:DUF7988 domain-containing protein n=1 Tax=Halovivax ruber (strain DSM 18193 / JCM 13892 / XH-70) TaxID=797302 RepID=L0IDS6_HALRX|nr:hypothetical protein [Halovivax ruber]AGB16122.1 hypothetical protein Halru_1514 [Halovivax ruber XH-70]